VTNIHRQSEVARLTRAITEAPAGLSIVSVSGAGGVGKSYLVHHVLDSISARAEDVVSLRVDGSNRDAVHDFVGLIEALAPRQMPPPAKPNTDHFGRVRKIAEAHRDVLEAAQKELVESGQPEEVRRVVTALLRFGRAVNKASPWTKDYLDAEWLGVEQGRAHEGLDKAWDLARSLDSLKEKTGLPGVLREGLGVNRHNRVKRDLPGVMAEALVEDLVDLATPFRFADLLPGRKDDRELRRVLLWFDDWEAIGPALAPFVISHLVPRLAVEHDMATVLLMVGRDDIADTDTSWNQHCERFMSADGTVRLEPFDRDAALDYLGSAGITGERAERIWETTQGFPFLLSLLVEEERDGAGRALFLHRFFERTTKWMSPTERTWFEATCYLDVVNKDTLAAFFPGERVDAVYQWFVNEASIRDPLGAQIQVRPLVRDKVLRLLAQEHPSRHAEMEARARSVDQGPSS